MKKIFLILGIITLIIFYRGLGLDQYVNLETLKAHQVGLNQAYLENPVLIISIYFIVYVISTALSLPGAATLLTLLGGALFGILGGTLIVSFASTTGATLAFYIARFIMRDWIESNFGERLKKINEGLKKDGSFYILSLRLLPVFPFFMVNILLGLTQVKTKTYFFTSQIGMLPGTLAYVNAGTQLSQINSLKDVLSFEILLSFTVIGLLPLLSQSLIQFFKTRKYLKRFKKPKSFDYNIVVIGAGSGGLVSAYIAAAVKAKVALIEKHKMGGDCLNTGCVPSKAIIRSAKIFNYFKNSNQYGLRTLPVEIDFSAIMKRVHSVIQKIEPHDSVERYTGLGVECIQGEANILSPYEVDVNGRVLTTKNIIIASGARPLVPAFKNLNHADFVTSDTLWSLNELPKKLLVLGGGPVGCELAQSFARLGSRVTLVEKSSRLLFREDPEASQIVLASLMKDGVEVLLNTELVQFSETENTAELKATATLGSQDNSLKTIGFDKVLIALGRQANVTGFGLEALDIELHPNGTIAVDEYMRTTRYPNIYACGDVAGPYQLTHAASHQAWFATVNALFSPLKKFKIDYRFLPWCTFTDPEVARVGLNENEAKAQGLPYRVSQYEINDLDRAIADSVDYGFVKVLTPPDSDRILGVTIVGHHAGDIIAEYVLAMKSGLGLNKILGTIHIYPTLAEANKYAAGVWKKQTAPQNLLDWVKKFHTWRRQ